MPKQHASLARERRRRVPAARAALLSEGLVPDAAVAPRPPPRIHTSPCRRAVRPAAHTHRRAVRPAAHTRRRRPPHRARAAVAAARRRRARPRPETPVSHTPFRAVWRRLARRDASARARDRRAGERAKNNRGREHSVLSFRVERARPSNGRQAGVRAALCDRVEGRRDGTRHDRRWPPLAPAVHVRRAPYGVGSDASNGALSTLVVGSDDALGRRARTTRSDDALTCGTDSRR